MPEKQRLYGPTLLMVYGLASLLLLLIFFMDDRELAIILSPVLPFILLVRNARRLDCLLDFRLVYLSSILVWSFGKSWSVLVSYGHSGIGGTFVVVYLFSMIIAPALALLFRVPSPVIYFTKLGFHGSYTWMMIFLMLTWLLLSIILYGALSASPDDPAAFVLKQLSQGFLLVTAAVNTMLLFRRRTFIASCLILFVAVVTVFIYLHGPLNRTSLLLPVAVLTAAVLAESKLLAMRIKNVKVLFALIFAVPFLSLVLFMGDLQKQTGLTVFDAVRFVADHPEVVLDVVRNSNYLADGSEASAYFNSVSTIIESGELMPGGLFYQLASSVMPRIFFPDKGDTDLSLVMWKQGYLPQPMYYEIFLEPILDSHIIGVVVYYLFFLFFVWVSWVSMTKNQEGFRGIYSRSVYLLNLVVLFIIIRGPVIFIVWYALLPNLILWWWLLYRRMDSSRKTGWRHS